MTYLKWFCLFASVVSILFAMYFLTLPKPKVAESTAALSNEIVDVALSQHRPFEYALTAHDAHDVFMHFGVFRSTLLRYLVFKKVVFHAVLDKFGEVSFQTPVAEMDMDMQHITLKYPVLGSSKSGLQGVFQKVEVNLHSGEMTIRGASWSFQEKHYRLIKVTWHMASMDKHKK